MPDSNNQTGNPVQTSELLCAGWVQNFLRLWRSDNIQTLRTLFWNRASRMCGSTDAGSLPSGRSPDGQNYRNTDPIHRQSTVNQLPREAGYRRLRKFWKLIQY